MMANLVIPTTQAINTYSLQITTDIPLTSIVVRIIIMLFKKDENVEGVWCKVIFTRKYCIIYD